MIAVLKQNVSDEEKLIFTDWLRTQGLEAEELKGQSHSIMAIVGDTSWLDPELVQSFDAVRSVRVISEVYSKCSRRHKAADTVVTVGGVSFGGGSFALIAGPCSVESREQIIRVAERVKASGASVLRGGAFKPRTSPYDFQGLKAEGLKLLSQAKQETGLPIVSEIMNLEHLELFEDVDIIQVGARNMQNYELLRELGRTRKTVLLKRGLSSTIRELLLSAEYIFAGGNENIILCERGIRTYETSTRNTLDLSAVPVLHEMSHLPVVVDPSHATGHASYVPSMALAAAAAGADGIMLEVHNEPLCALCDGAQSITPEQFDELARKIFLVRQAALG